MKNQLMQRLSSEHTVVDCGNTKLDPTDDHVDFVTILAHKMAQNPESLGVVICGSGCGVNIGANRYAHLRATMGYSHDQIVADCHDDLVNVLSLGAEYITPEQALGFVETFLRAPRGEEEKYKRRLAKFSALGSTA